MKNCLSTILVASALVLTISGCGLVERAVESATATPSLSDSTTTGEEPAPGEGSSQSSAPESLHKIVWRDGAARVEFSDGTSEPVGSGLEVEVSGDVLAFDIPLDGSTTYDYVTADGSLAVFRGGDFALALNSPRSSEKADFTWVWVTEELGPTLRVTASDAASSHSDSPHVVSTLIGETAVESASWKDEPEGPRVSITPGEWARSGSVLVYDYGWQTVERDVPRVTEFAGKSLEHQFVCHVVGARDKDTWNLETWYEDIGTLGFMKERCNPL